MYKMCSQTMLTTLAFIVQELAANRSSAHDSIDKLDDALVGKLLSSAFQAPGLHAQLENTMLGKPGHQAVPLRKSLGPFPPPASRISTRGDFTPPGADHRSQSHPVRLKVTPGGLPWAGHQIGTSGSRVQASAFLHHEVAQLASATAALPVQPDDIKIALSMLSDLPRGLISWYDNEVLTFPLMTKAATSGVCYSVGDMCAQGIAGKNISSLDLSRSARSGVAGFIGHGPIKHYEFDFLNTALNFGGAWWAVVPKLAIEEGPMSIIMNTLYSLIVGAFAFRDPREVLKDVRAAFVPGFKESIRFWPAVDLLNFSVVPIQLQVLFSGTAQIFWVCILSRVNNEGIRHQGADAAEKKAVVMIQGK